MPKLPLYAYFLIGLDVILISLCVLSVIFLPLWAKVIAFSLGATTILFLLAGLRRARKQGYSL